MVPSARSVEFKDPLAGASGCVLGRALSFVSTSGDRSLYDPLPSRKGSVGLVLLLWLLILFSLLVLLILLSLLRLLPVLEAPVVIELHDVKLSKRRAILPPLAPTEANVTGRFSADGSARRRCCSAALNAAGVLTSVNR